MLNTVNTLYKLRRRLSPRDMEILSFMENARCVFTHQITRLFFNDAASDIAASKACRRALNKLRSYKLVDRLDREIGGYKAGSFALVWHLTDGGYKLLDLEDPDTPIHRKRFVEPSSIILNHRLVTVESYVQMVELSRASNITVREVKFEPKSWKQYPHNGKNIKLRPDLFLAIGKDGYEYLFYVEIDLASESMTDILRQCERYHDFYNSNVAQKEYGIFPTVLWIVPNEKRKNLFIKVLKKQYEKTNHLFCVITADELAEFMLGDIDSAECV